jgi:hypothetical protein
VSSSERRKAESRASLTIAKRGITLLTIFQAEAEAGFRWGGLLARGFARHSSNLRLPFEVGIKRLGKIIIRGRGTSWESAFRSAADQTNADGSAK